MTTGTETYPAGRYLDLHPTSTGLLHHRLQPGLQPVLRLQRTVRLPVPAAVEPAEGGDSRRREGARRMTPALQAIVFDFDGVIADSEPLHFTRVPAGARRRRHRAERRRTTTRAISATTTWACSRRWRAIAACRWTRRASTTLVARKGERLQAMLHGGAVLFPGAVEFIRAGGRGRADRDRVGRAAPRDRRDHRGGRRRRRCSRRSSPRATRPRASRRRRRTGWRSSSCAQKTGAALDPRRCVAIEDSRWGLESARGAGLRCVGVTNSYPAR